MGVVTKTLKNLFPSSIIHQNKVFYFKRNQLSFDFYLPQYNILVDVQDSQCTQPSETDRLKSEWCDLMGATLVSLPDNEVHIPAEALLAKIEEAVALAEEERQERLEREERLSNWITGSPLPEEEELELRSKIRDLHERQIEQIAEEQRLSYEEALEVWTQKQLEEIS